MSKIKFLFIGGVPHESEADELHKSSIGLPQFASESFQKNFFEKLERLELGPLDFISLPYTGVNGIHTKLFRYNPVKKVDGNMQFIPFSTLPGVYSWSRERALTRCLEKRVGRDLTCPVVIYVYAIHLPFIKAALNLKYQYGSKIKLILIIPDLPHFTHDGSNENQAAILKGKIKSYFYRSWENLVRQFDGFIVFSEEIASFLSLEKNYFTLLGLSSAWDLACLPSPRTGLAKGTTNNAKRVLYAGGLDFRYGLKELVDGTLKANDEGYQVSLLLCGNGDAVPYIEKVAHNHRCIKYYGVKRHEEVLYLESQADFLVNPRPSTSDFVKYSFPSKMFEYCMQAKPIIGFRLPPYPQSLLDAMIIPESEDAAGIANSLIKACELNDSEIRMLSKNARNFFDTFTSDEYFKNGMAKLLASVLN